MNIILDKVGADVEWFLKDKNGNPVPCIGLVGGTKTSPLPLIPGRAGYMIQEDNVALEWGIPPSGSRHEFLYHCMRAREAIDAKLAGMELIAAIVPSMRFTKEQLEHPQAKTVGCEADYCVWDQCENEKPDLSGENETLRSGGGHVHISFKVEDEAPVFPKNLPQMETVVMAFDMWVSLGFVVMDPDKERRKLYGKAGAFRPKPYGVECRTLSNLWSSDPLLTEWVYTQIEKMFHYIRKAPDANRWLREQKSAIVPIINNGDVAGAQRYLSHMSFVLPR
jgi:hypothetical protein